MPSKIIPPLPVLLFGPAGPWTGKAGLRRGAWGTEKKIGAAMMAAPMVLDWYFAFVGVGDGVG